MDFKRLGLGLGALIVVIVLVILFYGNKPALACFAENDSKIYVGLSPVQCETLRFTCDDGEEYFSDECGCGCRPSYIPNGNNGTLPGKLAPVYCSNESRSAEACTLEYNPVCGWYDPQEVQCVSYPCAITVSNSCFACINEDIMYYTQGECPSPSNDTRQ